MKTRPIEPIFAALFANLTVLKNAGTLKSASRKLQHVNDYDTASMPAAFQNQTVMAVTSTRNGPIPKNRINVDWYFYVPGSDGQDMSTALNTLVDAALNQLAPSLPGQKNTLGGLVEDCYVEGNVEFFEGVLQDRAVAVLPIVIVAPGF